ncbi:EAL domain-containing protein [Roseomonas sp. BN140053]|uniref:sensor domain-containing phosphodiesterase n=1 Tax=Roseomonas sp. BN140053 TaxID=3391898 RepID=UPI0039ED11D9
MPPAPLPIDEADRLSALHSLSLLDTPAEPNFDFYTRLAARLCEVPIAAVSLIDADRQWFKSAFGLEARQTPRDLAFCTHAILNPDEPLVVPDTTVDARFAANPMVLRGESLRFYAGMPLRGPDRALLGAVCIADTRPRIADGRMLGILRDLTLGVASVIEQHARGLAVRPAVDALSATAPGTPSPEDLREAMVGENTGLDVHLQPICDARDCRIVSFEALLRWDHPRLGQLSPGDFLPLAEQAGLSELLDDWVLRRTAREAVRWPEGAPTVAVNLSTGFLRPHRAAAVLATVLAETGLPAGRLEVELPEALAATQIEAAAAALSEIGALGVGICLDDFGAGQATGFAMLARLGFRRIKLDRLLVAGLEEAPATVARSEVMLRALIGMAHGLGAEVVAEGVENEAQLAFLARAGCDAVQGWLTGRPEPAVAWRRRLGAA